MLRLTSRRKLDPSKRPHDVRRPQLLVRVHPVDLMSGRGRDVSKKVRNNRHTPQTEVNLKVERSF